MKETKKIKRSQRDFKKAMEIMVENNYSIRELSNVVKIPKTTLHRKMAQEKKNVAPELWDKYLELLKKNNEGKGQKATISRWKKAEEKNQNESR